MPIINLPPDTRWQALGEGLRDMLAPIAQAWQQRQVSQGVSQIVDDPGIPNDRKYAEIMRRFGRGGMEMFGEIKKAQAMQEQVEAFSEKRTAGDVGFTSLKEALAAEAVSPQPQAPANVGGMSTAKNFGDLTGMLTSPGFGVQPSVAAGFADYLRRNESGLDPNAVNPTSGALGEAQWLGPRKAALQREFGPRPSGEQQVAFLGEELQGPERTTLDALRKAQTPQEGYAIAGTKYERPGPAALARAGVKANDIAGDVVADASPADRGRLLMQHLAERIEANSPEGTPGHVKMMAFEQASHLLAPEERMAWEAEKLNIQQAHRFELLEARMAGRSETTKWQMFTDPKNGQQYWGNPVTLETRDLHGQPYSPSGAQKLTAPQQARTMAGLFAQKYIQEHKDASSEELGRAFSNYRYDQAVASAFGGGTVGTNLSTLNTVADHVLRVKQYADALKSRNIPLANRIANSVYVEGGHPEVTTFEIGRDIMANEVVRLLTSTGGTEADRQEMQKRISTWFSPPQFAGVFGALIDLTAGRFKAIEQRYTRGDQVRRKQFEETMLTEDARQVFREYLSSKAEHNPEWIAADPTAIPEPATPSAVPGISKAPATAAPTPSDIPSRPKGVPDDSEYSPSRKQWRDPTGKKYDADGKPL